jgi:glycosyltransferase involved in cell wall biosynthesis
MSFKAALNEDAVNVQETKKVSTKDNSLTQPTDILSDADILASKQDLEKRVIITIPAYNEIDSIEGVIQSISIIMKSTIYSENFQILVIDDGSTDGTVDVAKKAGATVYSHENNKGLANTFRSEMKHCLEHNADIIIHIDADGQYSAEQIPDLLAELQNGYDLVLGSRFLGSIEYMPWIKKFGNRIFSRIVSRIIKQKISDSQTGFRVFTREIAEKIEITSSYTYTQEQIIKVARRKYKIKEIPIHFKARLNGKSRLIKSTFEYALKASFTILRILREKN